MLSNAYINEYLEYNNGNLFWKKSPAPNVTVGDMVGSINAERGYRTACIQGFRIPVHRIIFYMFNDYLPVDVDHRNGNRLDNNHGNLRASTKSQNRHNTKILKRNTSGVKGVHWSRKYKGWVAQIVVNSKHKYLGLFWDKYTAELTIRRERLIIHGEFANHG